MRDTKKLKRFTMQLLTITMVGSLFATTALAALSTHDENNLSSAQQRAVEAAGKAWSEANARGDTAGMAAAHSAAEAVRQSAGYSGGSDGSGYKQTTSQSKMPSSRNSSATNTSTYNKEAQKTVDNGSYGVDNHNAADEKAMAKHMSDEDMESLAWLGDAFEEAAKNGDTATTKLCHELAEVIRNANGYSGGVDGGFYIPTDKPKSNSRPSSGGSSYTPPPVIAQQFVTVTASDGVGGSISPSGTFTIAKGSDKAFTITPNTGYKVVNVVVDGVSKGAIRNHTFQDVTANHTISATFAPAGKVGIDTVKVTDLKDNNLATTTIKSGYGIFAKVNAPYNDVSDVKVVAKYNFGEGQKTATLEKVGSTYQFPENSQSPNDHRCVYIPVEAKDKAYTLNFTITGTNAAGETVTDTESVTIEVKGNMYEDDFTSDFF